MIPAAFADANEAHSIATNYMQSQSDESTRDAEGIPIVFSAVDGDKLVMGISAAAFSSNTTYTESQVQEFLGITTPVEITYLSTMPLSVGDPVPWNADQNQVAGTHEPSPYNASLPILLLVLGCAIAVPAVWMARRRFRRTQSRLQQ